MNASFIGCINIDAAKSEYREMINSVQAAWALVGHKLKNHSKSLLSLFVIVEWSINILWFRPTSGGGKALCCSDR